MIVLDTSQPHTLDLGPPRLPLPLPSSSSMTTNKTGMSEIAAPGLSVNTSNPTPAMLSLPHPPVTANTATNTTSTAIPQSSSSEIPSGNGGVSDPLGRTDSLPLLRMPSLGLDGIGDAALTLSDSRELIE